MKSGFLKHVNSLITQSDLVIEVVDARRPSETRNYSLEKSVLKNRKNLLIVMNKSDLIEDKKLLEQRKEILSKESRAKVVFISAKERDGINMIRREMGVISQRKTMGDFVVGIIGYPNVGKSTLINALAGKGRGRVATSKKAGLTRGIAKVKVTDGVYLIDSPGIIPMGDEEFELYLVESKNPNQLKDVDTAAVRLIQMLGKDKVTEFYGIDKETAEQLDEDELLEEIAKKKNLLMKGGKGDPLKGARDLLERYQRHELK